MRIWIILLLLLLLFRFLKFSPQHLPLLIFRTRRRRRRSRRRKNELPVSYGFARPSLYYLWKQRKRYIKAHDNCPCVTPANSYWHDLLNRHYRTFSPSRVRGYIKVPFFQFRYLNLLIISHGWHVANQNQNPVILSLFAKPIKFLHSFRQPVTLWRNFIISSIKTHQRF